MKDKFERLVSLGRYAEALVVLHDHGDESFARVMLERIQQIDVDHWNEAVDLENDLDDIKMERSGL